MKKSFTFILAMMLIASMTITGCGSSSSSSSSDSTQTAAESEALDPTAATFADNDDLDTDFSADTDAENVDSENLDAPASEEDTYILTDDQKGMFVCQSINEGIYMQADGSFVAYEDYENKAEKLVGTFTMNGNTATCVSQGIDNREFTGTFDADNHAWTFGGDVYESSFDIPTDEILSGLMKYKLVTNGEDYNILAQTVSTLTDKYNHTNDDNSLKDKVQPGTVATMTATNDDGVSATIKAINTYENAIPLSECTIISFETEDKSGCFNLGYGNDDANVFKCGDICYDTLLKNDLYDYNSTTLVYKQSLNYFVNINIDLDAGKELIDIGNEVYVSLTFDSNHALTSYKFEMSDLVNDGLNDNVASDQLADMDEKQEEEVEATRTSILDELKSACKDSDIDIDINEKTGEVTMGSDILFAPKDSSLSKDGKAFLKKFMKVYASVLLSGDNKDKISEIRFEGHTTTYSSYAYCEKLSQERADNVLNYCIKKCDLSSDESSQLKKVGTAVGRAYSDVIYDENGNEDYTASRRVTIKFFIKVD